MSARLISNSKDELADYTLKLVVVGEPFVGKSSILDVLAGQRMIEHREPTIGIEFHLLRGIGDAIEPMTALLKEGHDPRKVPTHYNVQIWDCAGQVRFRSIVKSYFRQAHMVIAVFNLRDRESFEMIEVWVEEIRKHFSPEEKIIIGLMGNKMDLAEEREVTDEEAQSLADSLKCDFYFPVSAKRRININKPFDKALSLVHQRLVNGEIKLKHSSDLDHYTTSSSGIRTLRTHGSPPRDVKCSDCF